MGRRFTIQFKADSVVGLKGSSVKNCATFVLRLISFEKSFTPFQDTHAYYGGVPADAPQFNGSSGEARIALLVKLRTRCISCRGPELRQVNTFGIARPPNFRPPPVRVLNPAATEAAEFSIAEQKKGSSFQSLHKYFEPL
jgi:hypothetical protein